MSEVRNRHQKKKNGHGYALDHKSHSTDSPDSDDIDELLIPKSSSFNKSNKNSLSSQNQTHYRIALYILTAIAFITRFYIINYPDEVVFDEVHFGKFASFYLQRTYFFDLHPPFAKLLIAFVGYIVGYDGAFKFDNIGESYITNKVPYVAYRSLSATLGALTIPIIFLTLKESGYSLNACILGAAVVLFDNAHVAETRLILLDSTLIISVAATMYTYVQFSKRRDEPFSKNWWKWLILTGVALSCVISTKYVGVFTFATVGCAVLIDLWNLLDYKAGLSLKLFSKHFAARFLGLILVPLTIFLFWFWVHFKILINSGPGDNFMSPEFQETLGDNPLTKDAKQVNFYDIVTIKHKSTQALLHSHNARYPLKYDDGRISSQGQQVTAYTHPDENNNWQIIPPVEFPEEHKYGVPVYTGQHIRLRHVATDTYLYTHDVASPLLPTNQEFTTISPEKALGEKFNNTLFEIRSKSNRQRVKTKLGYFSLVHLTNKVAMWSSGKKLPDWGFGQFDVNGNKNLKDITNIWYFDDIIGLTDPERLKYVPKERKKLPFFRKYLELQASMFAQNNNLSKEHPYASQPISWPFLLRGVSFWTNNKTKTQIYFIGNPAGWWVETALIAVYLGVLAADQLTRRRNVLILDNRTRSKLYNSMGFFFVGWATHYFPFFLMDRQKFLHHYLPAHLLAAMLAGALFDFFFGELEEPLDEPRVPSRKERLVRKLSNLKITYTGVTIVYVAILIATFIYFSPITYGWPSLTPAQVQARQFLNVGMHFNK
ncbi:uncharacterized protein SAPINGB_P004453 [Magnusiomyces paraingens]|uniref:Dolichyl-phosphate-mannose--protein mannosyltransferase n=1 Tax=Magnusiomyces paraingens TaxID=2606893 RepID=A0A5E8BUJ5_9ASCO|nr:uncharacterized protein SAPINGB_P004453 [Saprochaete ingens]VVT55152.1 unnamed protein product [Saprochaete ingens]